MSQTNINPIGVGLPSQSVQSLEEEYLRLSTKSSPKLTGKGFGIKRSIQKPLKKTKFAYANIYNLNMSNNARAARKAPTYTHRIRNKTGALINRQFFTNDLTAQNRVLNKEKWNNNRAYAEALKLQNELAKNKSRTRKRKQIK